MQKRYIFILGMIASACMTSSFAAKLVDLKHQPMSLLNSFTQSPGVAFKEMHRDQDFKQTTHARLQQMYQGYRVWAADFVLHTPKSGSPFMNGVIYQNLNKDLGNAPALQSDKMLSDAIATFRHKSGNTKDIHDGKAELMVYVDKTHQAHWAYLVSFMADAPAKGHAPQKPNYIMDAASGQIYHEWDNIQTSEKDDVGGGFGGNLKTGQYSYDRGKNNLAKMDITRDSWTRTCYLHNSDVTVKDASHGDEVMHFLCKDSEREHALYWDADFDAVNGGYSPANDALYAGRVIQDMYKKWYGIPPLTDSNGKAMMLNMRVHVLNYENAYWDGSQMTFGDGYSTFYPLVSLGVGAHEISHGFTEQHSGLIYWGQSGGLNEAFSDMAAQAAEFYSVGHNSWQIGPEIFKQDDAALRYMDIPSKDCYGGTPGDWCSIDNMSEYNDWLDVHFSSGIFNRIFYLIGSENGWNDTKKAFDVMVQANRYYWTSGTTFADAACGVLKATDDFGFDKSVVTNALDVVQVDYSQC